MFNDYDEQGYRINKHGNRSSRVEDKAIAGNMRFKFPTELANVSDVTIINAFDDMYWDENYKDEYGATDENRFVEYLREMEILT